MGLSIRDSQLTSALSASPRFESHRRGAEYAEILFIIVFNIETGGTPRRNAASVSVSVKVHRFAFIVGSGLLIHLPRLKISKHFLY